MATSQRADIYIKALGVSLTVTKLEEVHGHTLQGKSGDTIANGTTHHMAFSGNNFSFYGCEIKLDIKIDDNNNFSCHFWSAYSGKNSFTLNTDGIKEKDKYEAVVEQEGNYTDQGALGAVTIRVKRKAN